MGQSKETKEKKAARRTDGLFLEVEIVPIESLIPWEGNPRKTSETIDEVMISIRRRGMLNSILIRKANRMIIAGHTRWMALKRLGYEECPVQAWDVDEQTAKAYALFDNKSTEKTPWDLPRLSDVMVELDSLGVDIAAIAETGFNRDDIDKLMGSVQPLERPEIEFSEELLKTHNFIVLYFDNEIDWLQAETVFGIQSVKCLNAEGKTPRLGVGRVLKGVDAIRKITGG